MHPTSPLLKRIKRHVIGRQHRFFAATPPGFEAICLQELLKIQPTAGQACVTPGGVEFEGRLDDCYRANLNLRLPNRILMRISAFKSSNFRQLERKAGDIPWELYLHPGSLFRVHVTSRGCRLRHSGAIAERIHKSISDRLSGLEAAKKTPQISRAGQNIYVRGVEDRFTVSLDSSGDLLYKRGLKKHTGKAPLRETLAAGALLLAGYDACEPLLDPLCGTGTFSLEGALMAKRIPAGWFRDFAFTRWPSFIERRWDYIRRQAESGFARPDRPSIFASDSDRSACQKLESCIKRYGLTDAVQVRQIDFFDLDPLDLTDQIGTLCINPPYGRRLGGRQKAENFYHAMGDKLIQKYRGWKLALLAQNRKIVDTLPFQTQSIPIRHGGLKLALLVGKIQ